MSDWISTEKHKPKEGINVLLFIVYQRMCGGVYCEDEIILTGGIKDGDWFAGNEMVSWDYGFNLDFTEDDITHWMPLPDAPNAE